ncbi:MAG TPA: hypothetical protein VKF79_00380 [Candidatus Acidoferrum sp.]|nr:hypothetical protein [Candidatus Acidoferrum sp.]
MRRFALALVVLAVPLLADAQVRGGGARAGGGGHVIMAPRAVQHAAPIYSRPQGGVSSGRVPQGHTGATFYTGTRNLNNRPMSRTGHSQSAVGQGNFLPDFTGVPGLGFDYVHYAAVHPGWNRRGGRGGAYLGYYPFFDSGFLLPYPQSYVAAPDEPPAYQSQGPDNSDYPGDASAGGRSQIYGPRTVSSYDVVVSPQAPSQAYVFVRRDGTVFFAVAYSFEADNLSYVTQEGLRRTVARDSLDLNATQQFNEQRGLNFRIPVTS